VETTLEGHASYVLSVSFSPDGKHVADGFYYVGTSDGSIYSVNAESSQQSFISASVGSISALYPFVQGTGNDTAYFLSVVGDDGFATIDATTFEFVALNTTDTIAAGSCSDESLVYYVGEENQVWKVADFEAQDEAFAALDGVVLTTDVHTCAYNAEDGYIYLGHNEGQGPAVVKAKLTFD
jgi:WD40 repeat protein